jgi:membrane protein
VQTYLNTFMANAGKATGAGIVGLAVTAILLIHTIQTAFDRIFGSTSGRTQWNRFPIYWALLTLGPILFGVSFSISTYFFRMAGDADIYGVSTGVQIIGNILPFVLEAAGFALFYRLMPTRPVLNTDAIWGGLSAAFLFEVVKRLFGLYLHYAPTYQALYGALAAIPIFMVWMYFAWVITLIGAEITAALPEWRAGRRSFIAHHRRGDQLSFSLGALALLRQARSHGVGVRTQDFVNELRADPVQMHALLEQLQRANIIAHSDHGRWVLTRDLTSVTMHYLCRVLGVSLAGRESASVPRVGPLIERLDKEEQGMLAQSVEDALAALDKPPEESNGPDGPKEAANSR